MLDALGLLSEDELSSMIRDDGGAEVRCNFCNEVHRASLSELEQVRATRASRATS